LDRLSDLVERFERRVAQLELCRPQVLAEMLDRARAGDREHHPRVGEQPGKRYLRRSRPVGTGKLVEWPPGLCKVAGAERKPRDEPEPVPVAYSEHVF